jgi:hypothetical protein
LQIAVISKNGRNKSDPLTCPQLLGHHLTSCTLTGERCESLGWVAVEMDGAGTAQRHATPIFRAGQIERVPQGPQQGHVEADVELMEFTVDVQCDHGGSFLL